MTPKSKGMITPFDLLPIQCPPVVGWWQNLVRSALTFPSEKPTFVATLDSSIVLLMSAKSVFYWALARLVRRENPKTSITVVLLSSNYSLLTLTACQCFWQQHVLCYWHEGISTPRNNSSLQLISVLSHLGFWKLVVFPKFISTSQDNKSWNNFSIWELIRSSRSWTASGN